MAKNDRTRLTLAALAGGLALLLLLSAGCGTSKPSQTQDSGPTALANLAVARSALSTSAPDAKLLELYLAEPAKPTSPLGWVFVFGSPGTDKVFLVHTSEGKLLTAQEAGTAGLSADEWVEVPDARAWKVDSDVAFAKALAASGADGDPEAYMMGMLTYRFSTDTSTVEPFVWRVRFTPGSSGATTHAVDVDANTGEAEVTDD